MNNKSFGEYLRILRLSQNPPVTQEKLADAIGRQKMTISQFEQGKNAPPQGELLEKIIDVLMLDDDEAYRLRLLAYQSRQKVPVDVETYFFENPTIYEVIRIAQRKNKDDAYWQGLVKQLGETDD